MTIPNVFGQWKYGDWRDTVIQPDTDEEVTLWGRGSDSDIVQSAREEIMQVLGHRNIRKEIEKE